MSEEVKQPEVQKEEAPVAEKIYATYEDFCKLNLRVGTIKEAGNHPNADKLLVLKVDLGEKTIQLCAGIKSKYSAEELIGKQIVVIENLQPRALRGVTSEGMLLAASNDSEGPILISPEQQIKAGSVVK